MKKQLSRLLCMFLAFVMVVAMLPTVSFAAEQTQEDTALTQDDYAAANALFAKIDAAESAPAKKNISQTAKADAAYEMILASENYVEGSIERNGNTITWSTDEGIRCIYDPNMREKAAKMKAPEEPMESGVYNAPAAATKGGWPTSKQVYLIGPYYGIDADFTDQYKTTATTVAQAIGDTDGYTLYSGSAATVDAVATAVSNGAVVFFDSHGTTDYSSGNDYVTGAKNSYLCLTSKTGMTSADYADGAYYGVYSGEEYAYINGETISNHMKSNSPGGIVYMAICLGMATNTLCNPLRNRGVEVVYGYSQSVTFGGDYCWSEVFWNNMIAGETVATAAANMKSKYGQWDCSTQICNANRWSGAYTTISTARSNYAAFPIVVSDEDAHPGQRKGSSYGACSLQTVNSTYTLFPNYTVKATANNSSYGSVSINKNIITATPNDGYYVSGYTVTVGSATVAQDGNTFTVTAESDCTIQINFAAKALVTVSFSGAADVEAQVGYAGDTMALPTVTAPDGYSFVGWATAPLSQETTDKPVCYTSYAPAGDITLYAVYSYSNPNESNGSGDYVKVASSLSDWSGEYVIVYEADGYIFDSTLSTFDAVNNYQAVTISGNTISAEQADAYKVIIAPASAGYSILTASGLYIGASSNANTLTSSATALINTISIDASGNANIVSAAGAYLRYNKTAGQYRFRYYKSSSYSSQQPIALYAKDGSGPKIYYTSVLAGCLHQNTTEVAAVAAGCTTIGYTAGVFCNDCESYLSGHEAVEATGHDYAEVVTPPTETEQGYTTYTCVNCSDSYIGDYTDALGQSYVVSFVVPEGIDAIEPMNCANGGITLPTAGIPEASVGYSFIGWTDAPIDHSLAAPIIYTTDSIYTTTQDTTLYALYRFTLGGGSAEYILADLAEITATDSVVITMQYGDTVYAMSNDNGTSAAPAGVIVNVAENKLTEMPAENLKWNIVSSDGSYVIYPEGTADTWLYCTSANNGLRVGTNSANLFSIKSDYLYHNNTGRYIGVYRDNPDWRSYTSINTNIADEVLAFYVKSESTAVYYTTVIKLPCAHEVTVTSTNSPTCEIDGAIIVACESCGEILSTEVITAPGHNYYVYSTTEPNCTTDGKTTYTCQTCNHSFDEPIPATGHTYVDGFCHCGEKEPIEESFAGRYYIAAIRANETNYQYIKGELTGTRYAIEDSGCAALPATITAAEADKVFVIEKNADGTYRIYAEGIYEDAKYLGWTSGNSGTFVTEESALNVTIDRLESGLYNIHFAASDAERYLSLNATISNAYAAWYKTGQTKDLVLIPIDGEIVEHTHNVTYFEVQRATCEADGVIAYYYCGDETCPDYGTCYYDEELTISILPEDLIDPAIGHNMTYVNNNDGTHNYCCSNGCSLQVIVEEHVYIDGECPCGEIEIIVPEIEVLPALNVTPNISIGAEIQVMYTIMARSLTAYESFYLEVSKTVAGGDPIVTTYGLSDDMIKFEEVKSGSNVVAYRAIYTGIGAKNMGDEFTTTLYAITADGAIKCGVANTTSIKSYLMSKIEDTASSAVLKTLAVDMLNYGAAAQINFNYDAENLVNANLTEEQKALGTQVKAEATDIQTITGTGAAITASVSVQDKVFMYLTVRYAATDASKVKFIIKDAEGKIIAELIPTALAGGKVFQASYDGVGAKQMREPITIEMQEDGVTVSQSLTWSVESYVAQTRASSATGETLMNMVNALLIYGDSAAAYLAK